MIRTLAFWLAVGLAASGVTAGGAGEVFPVTHQDPITVRVLNGRNGRPLGHLHLTLIAGYNLRDLRDQFYREEVISNAHGQVRLSNQMENLPWLQVWVARKPLCQSHPRKASFSVDLMRRDGLSAPNHCGMATVEDVPGVFTVFVKGKRGHPAATLPVATDPQAALTSAPTSASATAFASAAPR